MTPNAPFLDILAALLFAAALLHGFAAPRLLRLSLRFPRHAGLWRLIGQIEIAFALWALVLLLAIALVAGPAPALAHAGSYRYTEPLFVFVVMVIAASRPVLQAVLGAIDALAGALPARQAVARVWLGLAAVPMLGSLITGPAAMTIAALTLAPLVFRPDMPERLKYLALGVLFVNVSLGGMLTTLAPPARLAAAAGTWDEGLRLASFGWRAVLAMLANATLAAWALRAHLRTPREPAALREVPLPLMLAHLAFLAATVLLCRQAPAFLAVFLLYLGFTRASRRHQDPPLLRQALLAALFVAGLIVLGAGQQWWLQPALSALSPRLLFFGAAALSSLADNTTLACLAALVAGISEEARHSLLTGTLAGGGLTVFANGPNPGGVALLRHGFARASVGAPRLLLGAALPTLVALAALGLV
ncbi:hypothetical protein GT347_25215 [Xylophilus rhododendri]|uniref:Na+/H+ antiporter n=1 Tax=Xylophilus rhododendri TaxID=2697032 RepID=A0A857JDZ5_9BURK|nr:putative Na+/H+ antiporter [Xylophilus rhododendri]QHJ00999.1 hypothetical protein GT347_25215 [Xylophilus rhododendri]